MIPGYKVAVESDTGQSATGESDNRRNPGAAIETTEITNLEGAKVAWKDVKNACEIEGLTITEVCTRYRLKYPAVYARATRGKWSVISSVKKRAKELQKREDELTTTAAQWAKRGEAHRFLVFDKASGAIQKAKMRPPKSWKEFDLADRAARRAAGLENADVVQQTLIHINEMDAGEPVPIEARVIDAELSPNAPVSVLQEAVSPNDS